MEKNKTDKEIEYSEPLNLKQLWGMFRVVDAAPAQAPKKVSEQIVIYKNGATKRLYWYDPVNGVWSYVTASA